MISAVEKKKWSGDRKCVAGALGGFLRVTEGSPARRCQVRPDGCRWTSLEDSGGDRKCHGPQAGVCLGVFQARSQGGGAGAEGKRARAGPEVGEVRGRMPRAG